MNVQEIENAVETIDIAVDKTARGDDAKFIQGLIARGIWQVALQLAKLNATAFEAGK
jgi:hypothetical protein